MSDSPERKRPKTRAHTIQKKINLLLKFNQILEDILEEN